MLNLARLNANHRVPNSAPPNFTPQKSQGQSIQGPGPVIINPNQQGPGPVMGGPNQGWNPQGSGGPGGPGGGPGGPGPWQPGGGNQWQNIAHKIRPCQGKFTYIWLNNGSEFWFYIQTVSPRFIYGWRMRRRRWEYGRINLNRIDTFYCSTRESE